MGSYDGRPPAHLDTSLAASERLLIDMWMRELSGTDNLIVDHDLPPICVAVPA